MASTRCKLKCQHVQDNGHSRSVLLTPVYPDKDCPENKVFWENTPSGKLELTITNPAAFGIFEPLAEYTLDITKVEKA